MHLGSTGTPIDSNLKFLSLLKADTKSLLATHDGGKKSIMSELFQAFHSRNVATRSDKGGHMEAESQTGCRGAAP